jgi:hypothetical protein
VTSGRLFTVDEANELLPRVKELITVMRASMEVLRELRDAAGSVPDNPSPTSGLGDRPVPRRHFAALERLAEAEKTLVGEGVQVKDIDAGLIDFPASDRGTPVLLCWQVGEEEVAYFHDLTSGFAGRRPIEELGRDEV